VGAYARELDFNRYAVSRYMQCIGDKARNGSAGLGSVTIKRTKGCPTRTEVSDRQRPRRCRASLWESAASSRGSGNKSFGTRRRSQRRACKYSFQIGRILKGFVGLHRMDLKTHPERNQFVSCIGDNGPLSSFLLSSMG
jgi:hypothetical protein